MDSHLSRSGAVIFMSVRPVPEKTVTGSHFLSEQEGNIPGAVYMGTCVFTSYTFVHVSWIDTPLEVAKIVS